MGVVAHGLGERAVDAEARAESVGVRPLGAVVAVEDGHLEHVVVGVCLELAVDHGNLDDDVLRDRRAADAADCAHAGAAVGEVDRDLEVRRREVAADVHGVGHEVGPAVEVQAKERAPLARHEVAVDHDGLGDKALQIGENDEVGALAGRHAAHVCVDAEHLGGVDGRELERRHGVGAGGDARAQGAVHAALGDERVRVVVVGAQHDQARVDARGEDLRQVAGKREPGGAVAGLDVHAHAELGHDVVGRDGLVARADAGGDVGVEAAVGLGDGVVTGHALAGLEGLGHLVLGVLLAAEDAREVHHLAEADDVGPVHGGRDLRGVDVGTCVVEAGDGGDAGGRGEHGLERRALGVVEHDADALEADDVAALVRVGEDRGRAARDDDLGVLSAADHGGLDVDVGIDVAGGDILTGGVDDLRVRPDTVLGSVAAQAQVRHAAARDGDVCVRQDLARGHAHEVGVADHGVGGLLALRDLDERGVAFPQRNLAEIVDHGAPFACAAWRLAGLPFG